MWRVLWLNSAALEVECSFCVVWSMAHLDGQLFLEGLVKIMMYLGVKDYRCLRFRLLMANWHSDEFDAFCSVMLLDERSAWTCCNLIVQIHIEDQEVALGSVLISYQWVMKSYHGLFATISTCRAWSRGVAKYLAVFDSSRDELRGLVSLKVPCMDSVQLGCRTWGNSSWLRRNEIFRFLDENYVDEVCLQEVHLGCIENRGMPPGAEDRLNRLRCAYDLVRHNAVDGTKQPDFGISDFEIASRRIIIRRRLWMGLPSLSPGKVYSSRSLSELAYR